MLNRAAINSRAAILPDGAALYLHRRMVEALGLALFAVAAALASALASYNPDDPSFDVASGQPVHNVLGSTGAILADLLLQAAGLGAMVLVLAMTVWSLQVMAHRGLKWFWLRCLALGPAIAATSLFAAAFPAPTSWPVPAGLGGAIGTMMFDSFEAMGGPYFPSALPHAAALIAGFVALALTVLAFGLSPQDWWRGLKWTGGTTWSIGRGLFSLASLFEAGHRDARPAAAERRVVRPKVRRLAEDEETEADIDAEVASDDDQPAPRTRIMRGPARLEKGKRAAAREDQPSLALDHQIYELPSLGLLGMPKAKDNRREVLSDDALYQNARLLEGVLDDFGVRGTIGNVRPGPVVTLYELEPAPGLKSSRVIGLADDIARSMSAISARVAVIPGRNVIGIELPNQRRETVYLRELLASREYEGNAARLVLALGKDIGGEPVIADLARMPHLLIAGTTGSGKSVAVNTMILSLLYRLTPEQCRFIMIDPKMLELSVYDGIPHLLAPVVTDPKKAVVALKWVVREMEERYRKMSRLGVRNIAGFNQKVQEVLASGQPMKRTVQTGFDPETGKPIYEDQVIDLQPLPFIVVLVDEMADLMMVAGKDIEGAIQRLAQMARAAGIHLIMATQRPSVDVITGTIKANFPTRISFQVTSRIDSRTILNEQGAEQLLGQGDMLYMAGGGRVTRVHGPFVTDEEVEQIVSYLKDQGAPTYIDQITEDPDEDMGAGLDEDEGGGSGDALYDQALAVVLKDRKASTSYIQRRLQIGYNRAARLVERMEAEGLVSQPNHVGKREVLMGNQ
jgi:S-DNA-T family DNA segregation ATPase FtsK/SpoIIIE